MADGFMWFDLYAGEGEVAHVIEFYRAVFDGPIGPDDGDGTYRAWFMDGERPWAAVVESAAATAGRWVPYVRVPDLDAAVAEAEAAGGTVVVPRTTGPAGEAVTVADPAGALIALWIPLQEGA